MKSHPRHERTLVIIKPDGIQRALVGEVVRRYERAGLKIVGIKMMRATADLIEKHYTLDPEWRRVTGEKTIKGYLDKGQKPPLTDPLKITTILLERLVAYMTAGPLIPIVLEGAHAVSIVRKLTGGTEPLTSVAGTIRGDFVVDSYAMTDADARSVRNIVHASGSPREAADEIAHWFRPEELLDYKTVQEKVLYDIDLKGSFE